jgi:hypothetical protein
MAEAAAVVTELEGWSPRGSGHTLKDGTPITAWLRFSTEGAVVSDRGQTLSRLAHLSPGLRVAIRALCRNNDVQIDRGELRVHVPSGADISEAVDRLGRVCGRVAQLAL